MAVFKCQFLVLVLLGLFTQKCHQAAEVNKPQTTDDGAELWRLHDGVQYLISEDEGSCVEAERFCLQRDSRLVTLTPTNKDWIMSQAEGRKLWINMCAEQQSSTEERGWVCEKQGKETGYNVLHRHVRDTEKKAANGTGTKTEADKTTASAAPPSSVKAFITILPGLLSLTLLMLF